MALEKHTANGTLRAVSVSTMIRGTLIEPASA